MDLRRYIREVARSMTPKPTGVAPALNRLDGIRAVAFDIYGTLLISEAGDVTSDSAERNLKAMELVADYIGWDGDPASLLEDYESEVSRCLVQARRKGVSFPEVEIRDVWSEILRLRLADSPASNLVEEVAVVYESASNPVWPMPGASRLLERLADSEMKVGIVSNAQFYTPIVVEGLFRKTLSELGFSEDWMTFSYKVREGKPSPTVYRHSFDRACGSGLSPEEVLYVGNDMKKDIAPAAAIGFRTALFAGDARSLRLGEGSIDEAKGFADVVITWLGQILDVIDVKK